MEVTNPDIFHVISAYVITLSSHGMKNMLRSLELEPPSKECNMPQ